VAESIATGLAFDDVTLQTLASPIERAIALFLVRESRQRIKRRAMTCDLGRETAARQYIDVYRVASGSLELA
jgi:glycogen synthase